MTFPLDIGEPEDLYARLYQQAMYYFGRKHKRCGFFVDMGLGKTRVAGALAADAIYEFRDTDRVLIVGPKRVAIDTWPEELQKWEYTRQLTFSVLMGSEKQIRKAMERKVDIHITSYDRVHVILREMARRRFEYGMVILDESQKVRTQATRRHQACDLICATAERVVELSGTPSPNGLQQLWGQMKILDGGVRLGRTEKAFLSRWFTKNEHTDRYEVNNRGASEQIYASIRDICFSLLSEDYIQLPPLVINDIKVSLDDATMRKYERFEREAILEIAPDVDDINAVNASALYAKLTQFANGMIYDAEKNSHRVHDEKIEALDDIIEESGGENILVLYSHKHDRDRILKRYPDARHIHSNQSIADWKAGKIRIGVAHPASIGEGLNLQSGGRIMVWYGLTWNYEYYAQTVKRLWRSGQLKPVIMHRIFTANTIDVVILRSLKYKGKNQYDFLVAMKHRIEDVLEAA